MSLYINTVEVHFDSGAFGGCFMVLYLPFGYFVFFFSEAEKALLVFLIKFFEFLLSYFNVVFY